MKHQIIPTQSRSSIGSKDEYTRTEELSNSSTKGPLDICKKLCKSVYSIQAFLIVGFVIQVTVISVLLVAISSYTQTRSTTFISKSLRSAILSDIVQLIRSHMALAPVLANRSARSFESAKITSLFPNTDTLQEHLVVVKRDYPQIYSTYLCLNNTDLFAVLEAIDKDEMQIIVVWDKTARARNFAKNVSNYGIIDWQNTTAELNIYPYDISKYDWLDRGSSTKKPFWTTPYFDPQIPDGYFISFFHPVFIDELFVGVQGIDYTIQTLSEFLQEKITPGKTGVAYIMEPNGMLVAHTDKHSNISKLSSSNEVLRISAIESTNSLISNSAKKLLSEYENFDIITTDKQLSIVLKNSKVLIQFSEFKDEYNGLKWIIVVVIPENDYLGSVKQTRLIMGVLSSCIALVSITGSIVFSFAITIPLKKLGRDMNNIAKMEFNSSFSHKFQVQPLSEVYMLRQQFKKMKDALEYFGRYVPLEVVKILLADTQVTHEKMLSLRNENICIMFSDIENFTGISETLPPETLVVILEQYFREMSNIILQNEGTLDKYIGDAIMAFWNMPRRVDNYTTKGVRCALLMQQRLKELQTEWRDNNLPILNTRIGLNVGKALVGNVGSSNRVSYTAIGDSVNLASRIEGLNKYYGTYLMITQNVFKKCKHEFVCRPLDNTTVVGKKKAIMVYEVIDAYERVPGYLLDAYELYRGAFDKYMEKQFTEARLGFEAFLEIVHGDKVTQQMIERCISFEKNPPPEDWDGVFKHDHK